MQNLPKVKNMTKITKIRTVFMFKTIQKSYNIMLKKLLLASCTLLYLLEVSPTSNVRNTMVVRISASKKSSNRPS